jgi:arylsulfatase A-like enzyme
MAIDFAAFSRAMHHAMERLDAVSHNAKSFDQKRVLERLGRNPATGQYYRFDEHYEDAESLLPRAASMSPSECRAGCIRFEFDENDAPPLSYMGVHRIEHGLLKFTYQENGHLVTKTAVDLEKDAVGAIDIRMKNTLGREAELMWISKSPLDPSITASEIGKIIIDTIPDGQLYTYRLNAKNVLRRKLKFGDRIRTIIFRPSFVLGDDVEIDYIRFIPKSEKYSSRPYGSAHETLAGEMRQVLFTNTPNTLSYEVKIPKQSPVLKFGMGILDSGSAVEFSISVAIGEGEVTVLNSVIDSSDSWEDARIDLNRWAGKSATLRFHATSEKPNTAFWSNPVLFGEPARRFNVIILLEDTLRADHLSLYGHSRNTSPVKDALAKEGVTFDYAIAQATKTRPSAASYMTSLHPSATGVAHFNQRLDDRYLTLAEIMRSQGYATACFAQNGNVGPQAGLHQGCSFHLDAESLSERATGVYGERVLEWIEGHREQNFFLYTHIVDPHGPYDPPAPYDQWYREGDPGKRPVKYDPAHDPEWSKSPTVDGRRNLYDGEILSNDAAIKPFLSTLRENGTLENTLLIFMSDHGEHLGEHDQWEHHPPGFMQVIHVPLIMVFPGRFPSSRRIATPVQLLDLMPTILELAEVDREPLMLQGDSLRSLIDGKQVAFWGNRIVFSEEPMAYTNRRSDELSASIFFAGKHFLRSKHYPHTLVYEYAADPREERPLLQFAYHRELHSVMIPFLDHARRMSTQTWETMTRGGSRAIEYDPEVMKRLRALGYIDDGPQ